MLPSPSLSFIIGSAASCDLGLHLDNEWGGHIPRGDCIADGDNPAPRGHASPSWPAQTLPRYRNGKDEKREKEKKKKKKYKSLRNSSKNPPANLEPRPESVAND